MKKICAHSQRQCCLGPIVRTVVFIMLGVLGREGLGPLAHLVAKPSVQNPSLEAENKRSLDADEEA